MTLCSFSHPCLTHISAAWSALDLSSFALWLQRSIKSSREGSGITLLIKVSVHNNLHLALLSIWPLHDGKTGDDACGSVQTAAKMHQVPFQLHLPKVLHGIGLGDLWPCNCKVIKVSESFPTYLTGSVQNPQFPLSFLKSWIWSWLFCLYCSNTFLLIKIRLLLTPSFSETSKSTITYLSME